MYNALRYLPLGAYAEVFNTLGCSQSSPGNRVESKFSDRYAWNPNYLITVRPVPAMSLVIRGVQIQVWQWLYVHVRLGVRRVKPDMAESLLQVVPAALGKNPDIQCHYVQKSSL
jgi:hypothetical protein